jgi:tetratricopeptide (TPR) repeat protein
LDSYPRQPPLPKLFVTARLPWLLAAGMLAVYLVTLNRAVTAGNLREVVELNGWNPRPNLFAPLTFLLTYPLRWLPASLTATGANLCSALCAAVTLALLARSVTLLPERSQFFLLNVRGAWLPPALAVLTCGLQSTFWENATEARGETPDLLLFACLILCLLEFRHDGNQRWLTSFAFVYGLAVANGWAMAGFLPFFLLALLWVEPMSVDNGGAVLVRMLLAGLAGLSLLLLMPLIASLSSGRHLEFWPALRLMLGAYKHLLLGFPKGLLLLLGLTSVLPALLIGIRPRSFFSDHSSGSQALVAKWVLHLIYAVFLIVCIWVSLDCPASPRHKGLGFAFLPLYYLGALSIGYFSGHFLLVAGASNQAGTQSPVSKLTDAALTASIWLLLAAVPGLLLYRNFPQMRANQRDPWQDYFALVEKSLPPQGTVIVSDDPATLFFFQALLTRQAKPFPHLPLDANALGNPAYLKLLDGQYPQFKLASAAGDNLSDCSKPLARVRLLETLSERYRLYHLHPSSGYYLEAFYPEPHGLVCQLRPYGTNCSEPPPLASELVAENQAFWNTTAQAKLSVVRRAIAGPEPPAKLSPMQRLLNFAHLEDEHDGRARAVGAGYSRALNHWGVELQERGAHQDAEKCFSQARQLNPQSLAARVNLDFSLSLRAGKRPVIRSPKAVEDTLDGRRGWDQVLQEDGPFGEPNYCYRMGVALARKGFYRQAVQQFNRVQSLAPDLTDAPSWLTRLSIHTRNYSNALDSADDILKHNPNDNTVLFLKAVSLLQAGAYDEAIAPFTHLLDLNTNNYAARLNRAVAYLQLGKLEAARQDYEDVARAVPRSYQAWFGLAEIAYRRKDIAAAISNYQQYLTNAPPNTEEARMAASRLEQLKTEHQ